MNAPVSGQTGRTPIAAVTGLMVDALGKAGEVGCVEAGCHADFVAVKGDPLADMGLLADVDFVMKDGAVYKQGGVPNGNAL